MSALFYETEVFKISISILYLSISYNKNADSLYNNLVSSLLRRGHQVTIVTSGDKDYLEKISEHYCVLNVKTGNPFEKNLVKKGLNQLMIQKYFKKAIKKYLSMEKFDLILYSTPPITLYKVIRYCKNNYDAKTYLMLKDIFPQNAVDLGMISRKGVIYKYFRKKEKLYYDIADKIGCMSHGNVKYLIKNNPYIDNKKVEIFYNSIRVEKHKNTQFNKDKTIFIFGGNIGKPQNIVFLLEIIEELKDYPKAIFKIIGKGTEQQRVVDFIKRYDGVNLEFNSYLSPDKYNEILRVADVGLISLDYRFTIPNIPSKFQSYLRQKKPVLAITDRNTDIKDMILENDCGWWIESKEKKDIVNLIISICENKEEQIRKGKNGFSYFLHEFDVEKNVHQLEKFMEEKNEPIQR